MTALHHKLVRDLLRMRMQVVSIAAVVAAGIAVFVASFATYASLESSRRQYYAERRFADVFAMLKRGPLELAERLATIPGVQSVEPRIVAEVTLDLPDTPEPVIGRFVSLPAERPPHLNRLHLRAGRLVSPSAQDEVLVNEAFAKAHHLRPSDTLSAVLNGRRQLYRIVGIALSPEYIAAVRSGDVLPDDTHFGVLWAANEGLAAAFDMKGAFNDVVIGLAPGASEPAVLAAVDQLLAPYGAFGAYGRSEHVSHRYISDELRELRAVATIVPAIFLGVAAFLLNIVVARLIATERTQIATLKALGYSNRTIGTHYLQMVSAIAVLGAGVGIAGGLALGRGWTNLYTDYFHLPIIVVSVEPWLIFTALAITIAAAVLGTLAAIRQAVRLPPAEAMQPPAPTAYRRRFGGRGWVAQRIPVQTRLILRGVARRPVRAVLSSLGIAAATAILVAGSFWHDAMAEMIRVQFGQVQLEDATVTFQEQVAGRARMELARLPGVLELEGLRVVQVVLRHGPASRRTALLGLPSSAGLHRLIDRRGWPVALPPEGLLLTTRLAEQLGVGKGDRIELDIQEGSRPVRFPRVTALIDEPVGLAVYMSLPALSHLLDEESVLSAALIRIDPVHADELYRHLKLTPKVAAVSFKSTFLKMFDETFARTLLVFVVFLSGFGGLIVVGVVYNGARILLAERERELASLRVLGFTRREVAGILFGELGLYLVFGIPVGLLMGHGLAWLSVSSMGPETITIPLVVTGRTDAYASLVAIGGALATAWAVRRRLDRVDLIGVLKTRE